MEQTHKDNSRFLRVSILVSAFIVAASLLYAGAVGEGGGAETDTRSSPQRPASEERIAPSAGVVLPVRWGDLGTQMVEAGVIDGERFAALHEGRGGLDPETRALLTASENGNLKITARNAGTVLNLLWALGLGNKNEILERGPMTDPKYGGAGGFASTSGWTLAKGDAMSHYSRHSFITLTEAEQALVERVSKNVYRPCCNNPTHFPDCNHGMAMLGLLELMAGQGVSEDDMYRYALQVNAYWFHDTYLTIAEYLRSKGVAWETADPKELLGPRFSSASGYRQILAETAPPTKRGGGSCGV